LNERLGLDLLTLTSKEDVLSEDPDSPTTFLSSTQHVLPKGEMILVLTTWEEAPLPFNIHVQTHTKAVGFLKQQELKGQFEEDLLYEELNLRVGISGSFRVHFL